MKSSISESRRPGRVVKPINTDIPDEFCDLSHEVKAAREAAAAAGEVLKHYYRGDYKVGSKGHDNPVTVADLEADRTIREMLTAAFPDYGWLSEETVDNPDRLSKRRVWIVDPLDGTKEFITGIPEFCVAIGLADRGAPILGVTYNPVTDEMYWAARGMGCHIGKDRVRVTRTRTLHRANVLASRSETSRGEWEVFHGVLKFVPTGSVAYKLAMVAGGKADATFTRKPKNEWDIASGAALVIEAGGTITDIDGKALVFNKPKTKLEGLVASNGLLHEALMKIAPHKSNG